MPTSHFADDQGNVEEPTLRYCLLKLGLRMTDLADILHILHNMIIDAESESGVILIGMEFVHAMKGLRYGPFRKQINHSILKGATKEMRVLWDYKNPVLAMVLDEFFVTFPELRCHPNPDSDVHLAVVCEFVLKRLEEQGIGSETRSSRWWNFEEDSEVCRENLTPNQILLMFIGIRRRWYKGFGDNPLMRDMHHDDVCDYFDGPDPNGAADDDGNEEPPAVPTHRISVAASK